MKTTKAIVGAVLAMSLMANAVMAQEAGADKSPAKFKGPLKVFILAGQSNMEGYAGAQTLDELGKHPTHGDLLTDFPQLKGLKPELSGFVWFQGWNDFCAADEIKQQVYDEYCPNYVHLVQDLRAEFKVPNMPVVLGEVGVGGEKAEKDMMDFRAAQAKIATCPELKGTLGYVRTAPFWYPELDVQAGKLEAEEARLRSSVEPKIKKRDRIQ
jgi:hypothetical protein